MSAVQNSAWAAFVICVGMFTGCQRGDSSIDVEPEGVSLNTKEPGVRIVGLCDAAISPHQRVVNAGQMVLGDSSDGLQCIDESDHIQFEHEFAKLRLYRDGGASVDLKCTDEAAHDKFFRRHEGEKVALIAGNQALAIFSVVEKMPEARCGRIDVGTFEQATGLCEAFSAHWGSSADDCFELCDDTVSVCIQPPS